MTEPLEEVIMIRLSKTDRNLLDTIAYQEGDISISGLIRGWVRKEARERALTMPIVDLKEMERDN